MYENINYISWNDLQYVYFIHIADRLKTFSECDTPQFSHIGPSKEILLTPWNAAKYRPKQVLS